MKPQISIIMPVYNASKFLRLAIESVLKQSFSNFEFIIIDDGSSDNTIEIINHFFDYRIQVVKRKHEGLSKTLNYGLKISQSDIIARIDSDDIWEKDKLKIQYEFLLKNPEYKIIGTNCTFIDEKSNHIFEKKYPELHKQIIDQISYYNPMCHPSIMFYKNIILDIGGYNPDMEPIEDYDLYLRLFEKGIRAYNIQKPLVQYRLNKHSASQSQRIKQNILMKAAAEEYVLKNYSNMNNDYWLKRGLIEYYYGSTKKSRAYFYRAINKSKHVKKKIILKYIFFSLFGTRLLSEIRNSKYFFLIKRKVSCINKYSLTQT